MKVICIIPARLKSTRFPKKMLSYLHGKPLLQWVWERATATHLFDHIAFAVDAPEVAELVASFGATYYMTDEACPSGTDRLIEVYKNQKIDGDIWVNWQGDEPFITEAMIKTLLKTCNKKDSDIWTLKKRIIAPQEILSPHFAKVVCDINDFALYFSRSPIPFHRDVANDEKQSFYKHVGLYAFTPEALKRIAHLEPCAIEQAEQLEQLRFLYNNLRVKVHETDQEVFGIDLPEHLAKAEKHIRTSIA